MPYVRRGKCVYKKDSGDNVGCSDTEEKAKKYMKKLYSVERRVDRRTRTDEERVVEIVRDILEGDLYLLSDKTQMAENYDNASFTRNDLRRMISKILREERRAILSEYDWGGADLDISREDTDDVDKSIKEGDALERQLKIEMRQKAIKDFSKIYTENLRLEIRQFVADNPGIDRIEDVQDNVKRSIKVDAAKKSLKQYKKTHSNTELLGEYLARIERHTGKPIPPTFKQLMIRYAKDFAYQFVFGFIDNVILILAGAALDDYIKRIFDRAWLNKVLTPKDLDFIVQGVGNAVSDGAGDLGGGAVERGVSSWEWLEDAATDGQLEIATQLQKKFAKTATLTGVVLGCLVAIPFGLLILKGLTAAGMTAGAGMSLAGGAVAGVAGLVALGFIGATMYTEFKMLDKGAQSAIDNASSRVYSRLQKMHNAGVPKEDRLGLNEYKKKHFINDLKSRKGDVQEIWSDEMDFSKLASHEDMNYNTVWRFIENLSKGYGLNNPNVTKLDEARWLKLAGITLKG